MDARELQLVQPTVLRREWRLVSGADIQGVLRIPSFRSGGRLEVAGRSLVIDRHGNVRDEETGEEVGRFRRDGCRRVLELAGRLLEWKQFGQREGSGFVDQVGEPVLQAKIRSGFLHSSGEIRVDRDIPPPDAAVAALLAAFLLIRKAEAQAGATVAATTPTAGS
jgi:hypothetical protein